MKAMAKQIFLLLFHPIQYIQNRNDLESNYKLLKLFTVVCILIRMASIIFAYNGLSIVNVLYTVLASAIFYLFILALLFVVSYLYTVILNYRRDGESKFIQDDIKQIMMPYFLIIGIGIAFIGCVSSFIPFFGYILNTGMVIWYNVQVYLLFRYKFDSMRKGKLVVALGLVLHIVLSIVLL